MGIQSKAWGNMLLCLLLGMAANTALGAPWVEPGDERLRHHLQVLGDAGVLKTPLTTWPVMWGAIAQDLVRVERASLSDAQRWSLDYVQFSHKQAKRTINFNAKIGIRSNLEAFPQFSSDQRDETEAGAEVDWLGTRFAARLRGGVVKDSFDGDDFRYDGSYVAAIVGNWVASVGVIDRWWGPGWQSSLILSNSARPVESVALKRNFSDAFDFPVLEWLGPWTISAFAGQLESERAISNANLIGVRLGFKPLSALEISFSRTAQWGGEGRPDSFSSLWGLLIGQDNPGDGGVTEANEPGNQLGAIDWRLGGSILNIQSAFYMQYVGEDESGGFPSRGFFLYGLEAAFATASTHNRIHLEYTQTTPNEDRYDLAYEHNTYLNGYRYRRRPLGASFDNDSEAVTLAGTHYFAKGDEISWRIVDMKLNMDGGNRPSPSGSVFGDGVTDTQLTEISYGTIWQRFKVAATVSHLSNDVVWNDRRIKGTGFAIGVEYKTF